MSFILLKYVKVTKFIKKVLRVPKICMPYNNNTEYH